jgi:hypothetical protein
MLYTAPYVMLLMRANRLRWQVGGGSALEIETFWGPVKWHQAVRRVPSGAQKSQVRCDIKLVYEACAGILEQSMGARRNRVVLIRLSYWHARLHMLADLFLGIDSWAP